MMGELSRCEIDLPAGGYALDPGQCLDELLAGWNNPAREVAFCPDWVPPADVAETDQHYRITLEAPGIDMESLDITYEKGMVRVRGNKQKESEEGECCHCSERYNGTFERRFLVSAIDEDRIEATYRDGILKLTLPKAEKARPRKIEVQ